MISFFLEKISDNFMENLSNLKDEYDIVALTPKACFELDALGIDYHIPDDFLFPEEVDKSIIKESVASCTAIKTFSILFINALRAGDYWAKFLDVYIKGIKPDRIVKIGDSLIWFDRMLGLVNERNS